MKPIFSNRSLVIMGFSESVSGIGTWITMMAVFSLVIFRGQGGVAQSGLIFLAGLLPTLLVSPLAGWLCDRFDRKRLMIASELLSGLAVSGIIFTQSIELLYVLVAVQAATSSIMSPARQSSVPAVVAPEHLTQANAFLQQLASLIKIFGPMLGGLALSFMTARQAVILDVISYAFSAIILCYLPSLPIRGGLSAGQSKENKDEGLFKPVVELLKSNGQLRLLYSMAFVAVQGIIAVDILTSIFTRDVLKGGENLYGLEIGLLGFGTLLGAASFMVIKVRNNPWRDILGGLTLLAFLPAVMAGTFFISDLKVAAIWVAAACGLGGFGLGRKMVQAGTLLQTLPPAHLLGRASGLFQSVVVGAQIFCTLVTPLLVPGFLSIFSYFSLVSGIILLAVLIGVFSLGKSLWVMPAASTLPIQQE